MTTTGYSKDKKKTNKQQQQQQKNTHNDFPFPPKGGRFLCLAENWFTFCLKFLLPSIVSECDVYISQNKHWSSKTM